MRRYANTEPVPGTMLHIAPKSNRNRQFLPFSWPFGLV